MEQVSQQRAPRALSLWLSLSDEKPRLPELWGSLRPKALARKCDVPQVAHRPSFLNRNLGLAEDHLADPLAPRHAGFMTAETNAKRRRVRRKRNPFACKGWREFVLRSIRADEIARAAARARVTATGATLH